MAREHYCFYAECGSEFIHVPYPTFVSQGRTAVARTIATGVKDNHVALVCQKTERWLRTLVCLIAGRAVQREERRKVAFGAIHRANKQSRSFDCHKALIGRLNLSILPPARRFNPGTALRSPCCDWNLPRSCDMVIPRNETLF
jgi:hypothetical protein